MKRSAFGAFFTSSVRIEPSGRSTQPSSELKSALPVVASFVQRSDLGSRYAADSVSFWPTTICPVGSTVFGESPMKCQSAG